MSIILCWLGAYIPGGACGMLTKPVGVEGRRTQIQQTSTPLTRGARCALCVNLLHCVLTLSPHILILKPLRLLLGALAKPAPMNR